MRGKVNKGKKGRERMVISVEAGENTGGWVWEVHERGRHCGNADAPQTSVSRVPPERGKPLTGT